MSTAAIDILKPTFLRPLPNVETIMNRLYPTSWIVDSAFPIVPLALPAGARVLSVRPGPPREQHAKPPIATLLTTRIPLTTAPGSTRFYSQPCDPCAVN